MSRLTLFERDLNKVPYGPMGFLESTWNTTDPSSLIQIFTVQLLAASTEIYVFKPSFKSHYICICLEE